MFLKLGFDHLRSCALWWHCFSASRVWNGQTHGTMLSYLQGKLKWPLGRFRLVAQAFNLVYFWSSKWGDQKSINTYPKSGDSHTGRQKSYEPWHRNRWRFHGPVDWPGIFTCPVPLCQHETGLWCTCGTGVWVICFYATRWQNSKGFKWYIFPVSTKRVYTP